MPNLQPSIRKILLLWHDCDGTFRLDDEAETPGLCLANTSLVEGCREAVRMLRRLKRLGYIDGANGQYQMTDEGRLQAEEESHHRQALRVNTMPEIASLVRAPHPSGQYLRLHADRREEGELWNLAYRLSDDGCNVSDIGETPTRRRPGFTVFEGVERVEKLLKQYRG